MSVQFGSVVIYIEGGEEYKALVIGERPGNFSYRDAGTTFNEDHRGKNGEPTLSLAFAKQRLDPFKQPLSLHGTGQMSELVQFRTDVAHESHEYSAGAKSHFGRNQYDGGRWREYPYTHTAPANYEFGGGKVSPVDILTLVTLEQETRRIGDRAPRPETPAEEKTREAREQARDDAEDIQP